LGAQQAINQSMQYPAPVDMALNVITILVTLALLAGMVLALMARSGFTWADRVWFGICNWTRGWLLGPADPRDRALPHRRGLLEPLLYRK
jgi:hypothetical protein